ncbi:hypothetical protein F5Y06DRAFT_304821 [Hypoxylon sp. FL0890]|nr:hypothetical protein F5Y06DRAFT_304821 [Hypoxylon sp. FL0890]
MAPHYSLRRRTFTSSSSEASSLETTPEPSSPIQALLQSSSPSASESHNDIPCTGSSTGTHVLYRIQNTLDTLQDAFRDARAGFDHLNARVGGMERAMAHAEDVSDRNRNDIRDQVQGLERRMQHDMNLQLARRVDHHADIMIELAEMRLQQENTQALAHGSQTEFRNSLENIRGEQAHLLHRTDLIQFLNGIRRDLGCWLRVGIIAMIAFWLGLVFVVLAYFLQAFFSTSQPRQGYLEP